MPENKIIYRKQLRSVLSFFEECLKDKTTGSELLTEDKMEMFISALQNSGSAGPLLTIVNDPVYETLWKNHAKEQVGFKGDVNKLWENHYAAIIENDEQIKKDLYSFATRAPMFNVEDPKSMKGHMLNIIFAINNVILVTINCISLSNSSVSPSSKFGHANDIKHSASLLSSLTNTTSS